MPVAALTELEDQEAAQSCSNGKQQKTPEVSGGFLEQPGKGVPALMPAPNSLAPAAHSSSVLPSGISLICLRPSLISN